MTVVYWKANGKLHKENFASRDIKASVDTVKFTLRLRCPAFAVVPSRSAKAA